MNENDIVDFPFMKSVCKSYGCNGSNGMASVWTANQLIDICLWLAQKQKPSHPDVLSFESHFRKYLFF